MAVDINKYESNAIRIVRCLATLSILSCHFLQAYNNKWAWMLNVGVQVFFVLSGYLYGHKDITNWWKWFLLRFIKLYLPLYIYCFVALTVIKYFTNTHVDWTNYLKAGGVEGLDHLWFMKAIGVCYLITPILQLLKRFSQYAIVFLFLSGILQYGFVQYNLFTFSWFFLYSIGYLFVGLESRLKYLFLLLISIITIIMTASVTWKDILNYDGVVNRTYHDVLGIFICLVVIFLFYRINIDSLPCVIKWIDGNSLYIYITHHIYLIGPLSVVSFVPNIFISFPLVILMVIVSVMFFASISNSIIDKLIKLVK